MALMPLHGMLKAAFADAPPTLHMERLMSKLSFLQSCHIGHLQRLQPVNEPLTFTGNYRSGHKQEGDSV
jgi:hypothetical protein